MSANWNRSNDVVWEELDSQTLLVNPKSGARWSLNASAAAIWKLCDGSRSLEQIAAALAKAGGRCEKKLAEEITAFCDALARLELLVVRASSLQKLSSTSLCFQTGLSAPPSFQPLGAGRGTGRRPGPRGVSGPV